MTSEQLAKEVAAIIAECQHRILTVGHQQYADGDKQKFETLPLDGLFEYAEEELRDQIVYAAMLRIRLRGLRQSIDDHLVNASENTLRMVFKPAHFPKIVCLCGSTRFYKQFQEASLQETLAGNIVLSIGAAVASDEEHFGHLPPEEKSAIKAKLDELHLRKIDLADEVYVLNVNGYVGESTSREIAYAREQGKPIRWLDPRTVWPERSPNGEALP